MQRNPRCVILPKLFCSVQQAFRRMRFTFLDILRGLAVVWMIQVHCTNAFLDAALRSSAFFQLLNLSNGFVAPTFIFCAGAGMWIALSRKGAGWRNLDPSLFVYLKRLLFVLFWAYTLHVPIYSLRQILLMESSEVLLWLQFDVLHVIAYSSIISLLFYFCIRNKIFLYSAYALCCAAAITIGIFISIDSSILDSLPLSAAIPLSGESLFPIFPWSAYFFAGLGFSAWFFGQSIESNERKARFLILSGLLVPPFIYLARSVGPSMPWDSTWWQASPGLFLFRLSGIALLWGALYLFEARLRRFRSGRVTTLLGRESLFMYVSHLLIVYGDGGKFLEETLSIANLNYFGIAALWVGVTAPLTLVAWRWNLLKSARPSLAKWIVRGIVVCFVGGFLLL